jgi:hypothetical protein
MDAGVQGRGRPGRAGWCRAQSLRKIEVDGRSMMSVVRPEGFYAFDERVDVDEYVGAARAISSRSIPWRLETNTQGANRAHDAWSHFHQATLTVGDFAGTMRWGIRGADRHGRTVEIEKILQDNDAVPTDSLGWDISDHLHIGRDMMEWRFFAESISEDEVVAYSAGQISAVQYRYTPISVNVGYAYGSVETFEYSRDVLGLDTNTTNGVPRPMVDMRRP